MDIYKIKKREREDSYIHVCAARGSNAGKPEVKIASEEDGKKECCEENGREDKDREEEIIGSVILVCLCGVVGVVDIGSCPCI